MTGDLAAHIQALERKLLDPSIRKSAADLDLLLADGFTEIGSRGLQYTKQDIIAGLLRETAAIQWSLTDFILTPLAETLALAVYQAAKRVSPTEIQLSIRSSIWKNTTGRWQMVFHQGTPISRF